MRFGRKVGRMLNFKWNIKGYLREIMVGYVLVLRNSF